MTDSTLPADAFRLGSLTVVPSLNRLVSEDSVTDVEPRVMRVLAVLADTPGEVVTRQDLLDAVWTDTVVNEEALTRAVSELRKGLGDDARGAVETIRGSGYRLALPVGPLGPTSQETLSPPEGSGVPTASRRRGSGRTLVFLALGLAGVALAVALWAAWPRAVPTETAGPPVPDSSAAEARFGLDSTSQYYVPGVSDLGVYYDSTEGTYFRFEPEEASE